MPKKTKTTALTMEKMKSLMLVHEAKRWLCFTERGGDNKGEVVEMFQRVVDNKSVGEPWCMAFVQYCIEQVDQCMDAILSETLPKSGVEKSEHCLTTYWHTPKEYKKKVPKPGRIAIWRHGKSANGHAGIVVQLEKSEPYMWTVEGNTGPARGTIEREGDGVYLKRRHIKGSGNMTIVGFIEPWI